MFHCKECDARHKLYRESVFFFISFFTFSLPCYYGVRVKKHTKLLHGKMRCLLHTFRSEKCHFVVKLNFNYNCHKICVLI